MHLYSTRKLRVTVSRKGLSLLIGFGLWELAALAARTKSFPHSWTVLWDLLHLIVTTPFWSGLFITIWLSILGLFFGTLIALIFGISIGMSALGETATRGVLTFVRCIPSIVLLPLLVASIGSSGKTAVILTTIVVSFKLVLFVIRGIRETEPQLIESVSALGMPRRYRIVLVYLPSMISIVGTGMRLSASRAFGTIIATGIIAGTPGLGSKAYLAEATADYPRALSYVFVMGMLGIGIYAFFSMIERKFFFWRVTV